MRINLKGENLILHPCKAIYWPRRKALLLADLHLGKAAHFRNEGIPVPKAVQDKNLQTMADLIVEFRPERVLFLGDLFHSFYNESWEAFVDFLVHFPNISFELIIGNHDILNDTAYEKAGLVLHEEPYAMNPFLLSHHPQEKIIEGWYHFHGHIHPCVHLQGRGKQTFRLPCFHFGEYHGVLPAFGDFTGMGKMRTVAGDRVFVIADNEVLEV